MLFSLDGFRLKAMIMFLIVFNGLPCIQLIFVNKDECLHFNSLERIHGIFMGFLWEFNGYLPQ